MNYDKESFLAGLQLGRRMKALEAKTILVPVYKRVIVTQYDYPILTEDDLQILPEMGGGDNS